jgi:GTPase-associated protein 1
MIRQLHYTSLARGPAGSSGFQFSAWSDGVDDSLRQRIERLTAYQRPRDIAPEADLADYPVNLIYAALPSGQQLLARVVFIGADFSKRPGNYFAHSLVIDDPADDLSEPYPAELWTARFWCTAPTASARLPPMPRLPGDPHLREQLQPGLDGGNPSRLLIELAVAADAAMQGGRPVVVQAATSTAVWQWIMAASYVLGPALAPRLSFCTYSHDPERAGTHVIGTISGRLATAARDRGLAAIDVAARPQAGTTTEPAGDLTAEAEPDALACARMLVDAGLVSAGRAWESALTLAATPGTNLASWYPILACALIGLGDVGLALPDLSRAVRWLGGEEATAGPVHAVLAGMQQQQLAMLSAAEQSILVECALAADPELAGSIELQIADLTMLRTADGATVTEVTRLRTRRAREAATAQVKQLMPGLSAQASLRTLLWAAQAGVQVSDSQVSATGRAVAALALVDAIDATEIAAVAAAWPALRAGLVQQLARQPEKMLVSATPLFQAEIFEAEDFLKTPRLAELWLAARELSPAEQLIRICDLREATGRSRVPDAALLDRLWPDGEPTAAEAMKISNAFTVDELLTSPVAGLLAAAFLAGPADGPGPRAHWIRLSRYLASWPSSSQEALRVQTAARICELYDQVAAAYNAIDRGDAIADLIQSYETGRQLERAYLGRELLRLILDAHPQPHLALVNCPGLLIEGFPAIAGLRLLADPEDLWLAARIFVCRDWLAAARNTQRVAVRLEQAALEPVAGGWTKRQAKQIAEYAKELNGPSEHNTLTWISKFNRENRPGGRMNVFRQR